MLREGATLREEGGDGRAMRKIKRNSGWRQGRLLVTGLMCFCWVGSTPTGARAAAPAQEPDGNFRLLTAVEGRAIVDTALDQDQLARGTPDCSHVVHKIYQVAGYEYPYASSFDIYEGNESFARVKLPQAGDLIVWPGHVGIVVDPLEHSFYSLVRTGLETQYYDGPYWRSRGKPRFFRYRVENSEILRAANAPPSRRGAKTPGQTTEVSVIEERAPVETSASNRPPKAASERTAVIYGPVAPAAPAVSAMAAEVPESILIAAGNKQPTRDEVAEGISELSNAGGNVLRTYDPSKLQRPVVIFERLSVERLEIKRGHGWARLQVETRASLMAGGTDLRRRREKVRWELRRTDSGWEAVTPTNRTYVPQDVAVKNLAAQLARLTESDGAAARQDTVLRQESRLANLLSALLESQ